MGVGKTKKEKKIKWLNVIAIFFLGAFLGWLWETSFFFFRHEDWKNVGFLHGPWLPIYGVGCALIYLLKIAFGKNVFLLFTVSAILCAVMEYATSWTLEKIYHRRWWYYGRLPFNLHGRIYLGGILLFALAGCLVAYLVFPFFEKLLDKVPRKALKPIIVLLLVILAVDVAVSTFITNVP